MAKRAFVTAMILMSAGVTGQAARGGDESMVSIEADETRVYVHEAKKVEVRVRVPGASTDEAAPKWNLVQVGADGAFERYIGILYYSTKRQSFFRKLELQEKEPGMRFFEVVPDAELEPFVPKQRTRLVIEVAPRPTLVEILGGLWKKIRGPNGP